MMEDGEDSKITRRLDAILNVLLAMQRDKDVTAQSQILTLAEQGLKDYEIAAIFGKSRGYIASVISTNKER